MEQAITLLDLVNDDSLQAMSEGPEGARLRHMQRKRQEKLSQIWDFCHLIGLMLSKNTTDDAAPLTKLGNALLSLDFDPSTTDVSLENEAIDSAHCFKSSP
jgi:hypothetical protein